VFNRSAKREAASSRKSVKDLTAIQSTHEILSDSRFKDAIDSIRQHLLLSDARFNALGQSLINNLVQYYQLLPESTDSYFLYAGGLLDHALQRTESALTIFKSYLQIGDDGKYSEIQLLWQYALFTAGLLQGIAKLYVDYDITLYDTQGQFLKTWNPLQESLVANGSYYDYSYADEEDDELRKRLNLLLARQLMPHSGFSWIASDKRVLAAWLALLNEDMYSAGTLGCILDNADAVAIQNELKLQLKRFGGKKVRKMGGMGTFNDHSPEALLRVEQHTGLIFVQWLQEAIAAGFIMINQQPLFVVPGGALMSPDIFKYFVRENPEFKNWQAIQKGFLALGLHQNALDGSTMSKYEHGQGQKLINGIALGNKSAVLFPKEVKYVNSQNGEVLQLRTTEAINRMQIEQKFQPSARVMAKVQNLLQLNAGGKWVTEKETTELRHSMKPGFPKE